MRQQDAAGERFHGQTDPLSEPGSSGRWSGAERSRMQRRARAPSGPTRPSGNPFAVMARPNRFELMGISLRRFFHAEWLP